MCLKLLRLPERLEKPKNIDTKLENSLTKTTLHAHHRVVSARLSYLHAAGYCQLGLPPPPLRRRAIVRRWRRHGGGGRHRATRAPLLEPNDNDNDEHRHHHGLMGAPTAQRPMWFTQIS